MPSRYPHQATIRNEYLCVSKVIRAMTREELDWLVDAQLAKWREQARRKRQQKAKEAERLAAKEEAENLQAEAQARSRTAQQRLEAYHGILAANLRKNLAVDWDSLLDRRGYPAFEYFDEKPDRDEIRRNLLGPEPKERFVSLPKTEEPSAFEFLLPFLRGRRLQREAEAREDYERARKKAKADFARKRDAHRGREKEVAMAYDAAVIDYSARLREAKAKYNRGRSEFLARQEAHNNAIRAFRSRYQSVTPDAVERYAQMVLEKSTYPDGLAGDPEVQFDEPSKTLIVNFWFPVPTDIPDVTEYKFVKSRKAIDAVRMKQKEFEAFYDDVIHQIALLTVHELFLADYATCAQAIIFNGWVRGTDAKTGKPFTSCILSYEASREPYLALDLAHVRPKECVRGLKGITAGPLAMLAPVKPIMDIDKDDDRFVESREVIRQLGPDDNLAAMDWEDFEHLIRELFEREFSVTGGEVRLTQASRDRGVDAIAFDPDPIRGGKFIIQAKRYNEVVPVSAVRDLYGTMIAEGATKGILVTTSHFGRDSREFAKDKPITLIDGENLVYLFKKHGWNVQIALLAKGDPRRGLGQ
jgi:restriction system protein